MIKAKNDWPYVLLIIIFCFASISFAADPKVVSIECDNKKWGNGLLFQWEGRCYVITAKHCTYSIDSIQCRQIRVCLSKSYDISPERIFAEMKEGGRDLVLLKLKKGCEEYCNGMNLPQNDNLQEFIKSKTDWILKYHLEGQDMPALEVKADFTSGTNSMFKVFPASSQNNLSLGMTGGIVFPKDKKVYAGMLYKIRPSEKSAYCYQWPIVEQFIYRTLDTCIDCRRHAWPGCLRSLVFPMSHQLIRQHDDLIRICVGATDVIFTTMFLVNALDRYPEAKNEYYTAKFRLDSLENAPNVSYEEITEAFRDKEFKSNRVGRRKNLMGASLIALLVFRLIGFIDACTIGSAPSQYEKSKSKKINEAAWMPQLIVSDKSIMLSWRF